MCLRALDHDVTEDEVNKVMGARPMKGAAWEQALATAQHYGCRATLTMPATVEQLKAWTDSGVPVMIAWNPEGRPWSHASTVFDVDDDLNVYVADPNIPNPKETVRVVSEDDFYHKWYEKFPDYLVRRPACAISREVTEEGIQVAPTEGGTLTPYRTASATADEMMKALAGVYPVLKTAATLKTAEPHDCYRDGLRGRDLADCYKQFPNDLSSKDIQFVQKFYPRWSPHSSTPARRWNGFDEKTKDIIAKNLVAYAMKGSRATKSMKFLSEIRLSKKPPSQKQQEWLDNIFKSNEQLTRSLPDGLHVAADGSSVYIYMSHMSSAAVRWATAKLWLEEDRWGDVIIRGTKVDEARHDKANAQQDANFEGQAKAVSYSPKDWRISDQPYHWQSTYSDPSKQYTALVAWEKVKGKHLEGDVLPGEAQVIIKPYGNWDYFDSKSEIIRGTGNNSLKDNRVYALAMINALLRGDNPKTVSAPRYKKEKRPITLPDPPKSKTPAAPKTIVDSATAEKIKILDTLAAKVQNWPEGLVHVEKVKGEYEAGRNPDPDDLKKIRNFLYRNRMRGEANHFRTASTYQAADGNRWAMEMASSKVPADAEKVPGTKFWVSRDPSRSPYRGQKLQYKIYNEYGGVVGGSPDRAKAVEMAKIARAKRKNKPESQKTKIKVPKEAPKKRNEVQRAISEQGGMSGAGSHQNRARDLATGRSRKPKHKKPITANGPPQGTHLDQLSWIEDGIYRQGWVLTDQFTGKIVGKARKGWKPNYFRHGAAHFRAEDPVEWLPRGVPWGSRVATSIERVAQGFLRATTSQRLAESYDLLQDAREMGMSPREYEKYIHENDDQVAEYERAQKGAPRVFPSLALALLQGYAAVHDHPAVGSAALLWARKSKATNREFNQFIKGAIADPAAVKTLQQLGQGLWQYAGQGYTLSEVISYTNPSHFRGLIGYLKAARKFNPRAIRSAGLGRMAARADLHKWLSQIPGAEIENSQAQKAVLDFWQYSRGEGLEAVDFKHALEMAAWDMGYSGRRLPTTGTMPFLAKILRVDPRKEYKDGQQTRARRDHDRMPSWMARSVSGAYSGNPDGKPIYDVDIDHGENQALSGGHDIMKRLQDRYLVEQGGRPRELNPRLAGRGATLDRRIRQQANKALVRAGLDGNGRFQKPERGYSVAIDTIRDFGIELADIPSSHLFRARPSGTVVVNLAFTNQDDPFSPTDISNSILYLQFTELRKDSFEVVAYLS